MSTDIYELVLFYFTQKQRDNGFVRIKKWDKGKNTKRIFDSYDDKVQKDAMFIIGKQKEYQQHANNNKNKAHQTVVFFVNWIWI